MKFSKTEKLIYNYLVTHDVSDKSADEIADELFVSRTSIYRVCKKMGYKSFSEFKYLYSKRPDNIVVVDSLNVFDHVFDHDFNIILDVLLNSKRIFVFGTRATAMVSNYFSRQLVNLNLNGICISDEYELESRLSMFEETDCIVCFSNSGNYTPHIIETLSDLVAIVIGITKTNSPLSSVSDFKIDFDFPIDVDCAFERENLFNLMVLTESLLKNLQEKRL